MRELIKGAGVNGVGRKVAMLLQKTNGCECSARASEENAMAAP